ncbi:MAG: hypothetical protein IKK82_02625, partial [Kiritimatiellae bacterium]|nr:hypothetical protein [Kiritimatiellia bacterium]
VDGTAVGIMDDALPPIPQSGFLFAILHLLSRDRRSMAHGPLPQLSIPQQPIRIAQRGFQVKI